MDTRAKILDWPTAESRLRDVSSSGEPWRIVTGHFDPLLAGHVRRLQEIAGDSHRILAIVTNPADPILPAGDRAMLVAALSVVHSVTIAPESGLDELLSRLPEGSVVREEAADRRRSAAFASSVRARSDQQVTK